MNCSNCGNENRTDAKFCLACGSPLSLVCPNGHPVPPVAAFCDECGSPVGGAAPAVPRPQTPEPAVVPSDERRWVSVLFVDLVGFTTLSEGRDAEAVRDLLSLYFEAAQRLVALYGGTIEKFIGDAVMAVWGTPVAQEDDAERAVRTALDLVAAVTQIGTENGLPDLRARAGVLTGEAAVTLGAEAQGMVIGDMVNTASRIQSAAQPGTVFVGDSTRRATEAAVVYEDAGSQEMKGKAQPVRVWRAERVVAGRGGRQKSTGLEAPFVGRDRELRMMKELLHASAEDGRAHLVSITGIAGIGKSRLAWEFEKYVDGLAQTYRWHRGRCLAYGEGVTYWALAEMVRMRAEIIEGESPPQALAKLRAVIEEFVSSAEEREWIEPRLAHLLGLEDRTARAAEDLFSAWRLFFERISDEAPVIMVFEDMQWADESLVDFVDYLMNWSKDRPIFVVAHARPEFIERHPGWAAGRRGVTALYLEPLAQEAMEQLLAGLVPGLPATLRGKILDRAAGIPLYAVETVRMLLDRGLLCEEGNAYEPTERIDDLEVPHTLQALIAARLDGLEPAERKLIQDAAVVGKTFTKASLVAITNLADAEIERLLGSLLRKELITIQADPRSPERGQYGFLQDLVRRVAFDTLSRKDRKARHLAAAAYLESEWGPEEEEVVEVVASHYLEAYQAAPDASDAAEIKGKALDALVNAGRRAASLAAGGEARRYYERAIELADDPIRRAELHERAGLMARVALKFDLAETHLGAAIKLFEAAGKRRPAARASAALGHVVRLQGRGQEALDIMRPALDVLGTEEPDEDLALVSVRLGGLMATLGGYSEAIAHIERALTIAEQLLLPEIFAEALNSKAIIMAEAGRYQEGLVLLRHALQVALDNDLSETTLRSYNNIATLLNEENRHEEELEILTREGELARKVGNTFWAQQGVAASINTLISLGRWDEVVATYEGLIADTSEAEARTSLIELTFVPFVLAQRGDREAASEALARVSPLKESDDLQELTAYLTGEAWALIAEERFGEALAVAERASEAAKPLGPRSAVRKETDQVRIEAAFGAKDLGYVEPRIAALESMAPGHHTPSATANAYRFRARLTIAHGGSEGVEEAFRKAIDVFRAINTPFWLAVSQLELGEWLVSAGREGDAKPVLDEAAEIFTTLRARPWLQRLSRALAHDRAAASTGS